jgi:hypothetical protein
MAVTPGLIVKGIDVVGNLSCRLFSVLFLYIHFLIRSFFRLLKKDSATALSQQFPRLLMLGSRPFVRQKRRQSSLPLRPSTINPFAFRFECLDRPTPAGGPYRPTLGHWAMPEHFSSTSTRNPCGSLKCRHGLAIPASLELRCARRVFWRPGLPILRPPQSSGR